VNLKLSYSEHTPKIGDEIDTYVDVENIGKVVLLMWISTFFHHRQKWPDQRQYQLEGNINPSSK
jgi:hypothetical protein